MRHDTALGTSQADTGVPVGMVLKKRFPSDFRWVRRVIQQAIAALDKQGLTTEQLGSVEIVLAEALNNIVEHSYPDKAGGDIGLSIRRRPTGLLIEIRDRGRPMPKGRAPLGKHPIGEVAGDPLPEGGYGWFLIRELVRDLIYDRREGENFLVFRMVFEA